MDSRRSNCEHRSEKQYLLCVDPDSGKRANIGIVQAQPPYLRTYADGEWNNNLLSLDQCPL
ncbi:MAG: DUF3892 domain-containing protein [Thermodesulfobacteriota bacterium]